MAEIAVNIVIDKLLPLLDQEARLLGGVHTQVEDIKTELLYIQAFLKDADAKGEKADVSQGLKTWIQDLRETAYSIEDVIDEYLLHLGNPSRRHRFIGFLCKVGRLIKKLKRRHEVASKIRDIQKKVVKLKETSSTYGFISSVQPGSGGSSTSAPWHDPRVISLFIDEAEIVGIESQKIELTSRLVEGTRERTVISVVGMGGLGKTTLANKVYDKKELVGHFDCSAWITVSQSFKMEELLRNMSMKFYQSRKEPVPEGINSMDESSLMTITRQYLQDKRYVVVFDDVWKLDFWGFIKYVLPENKKGSRIIITTRNDEVASCCKESSFDYIHKLQPLPPKSSWELFCKKVFQGGCPPELEKLSHDIIRRCGGLPLAIVAIGGLLSRKEKLVSEWQKFNDTIGCELQSNSHLESINTILSLSYHDLPYYLKSCFLYLAIFPEDYTIRCGPLTRLWIAEGFVKTKRGVTLEEVAEEFLTELIQRSLVLVSEVFADGKIRHCHVHDLMREIILTKAEELSFCCVMGEETSSFDGRFRRLSVHNSPNNVANITGKKSYIRSIFLYDSQTFFLGTLASRFNLLKVLDIDDSGLDSVPENLGNLLHLRYLSLRNTKVRMLPRSIGKLQNLQTLDLRYTLVEDLPVEINRLKKLRNILAQNYDVDRDLDTVCVKGVQVKEGIGCLEELQKLSCVEANHGVGVIKELGKLRQLRKLSITKLTRENGKHLCASITNMNRLESLLISSLGEDEILDLQYISYPPPCLSRLKLIGPLEKLPDWISGLQYLSSVSLYDSNLMNDPVQVLQALPSLQHLGLFRASVVEQMCFEATGFQKLKHLVLRYLMGLKRVKIEKGALPLLEVLSVGPFPQLEELPPGIRHLTGLTSLEFIDLQEELKLSMIPSRGRNYKIVEHIPNVLFYGNETQSLRELSDYKS
ncbi:disease resistance protein RPM1-like isoform X2 [Vitis riparia]|uniref:disease resistance protein RPM1-like isoform X2 n=1 Tax=Vitis riparia TaxID=96939 RepID=UPI00155AEB2E|nr:disease resistance protein RPM1-like isoform X2 [Vitis riparia]